jgi:hypothetical protein
VKGAFTEAIDFFSKKEVMHLQKFYQLAAEARVRAFTVSRVTSLQILNDIHAEILKVLKEGKTLKEFQEAFDDLLFAKGLDPLHPFHIETVFRTNIQTSYQVGRYQGQMERTELRPYWIYNAIDDSRTTPLCYELGGYGGKPAACYRHDHPFWDKFYPPNHFNCRSAVDDLSEEDLEEEGIKISTEDMTGQPYHPVLPDGTVSEQTILLYPDKGFDVNPGKVAWQPDPDKFGEHKKLFEEAFAKRFGPVTDMDQLKDRINGLRENFDLINVKNLECKDIQRGDSEFIFNGLWTDQKIILHADRYDLIKQALADGRITSLEQADALSTLCHEFGHTLGHQINSLKYKDDESYGQLLQIVNDCWERLFMPDFCEALKLSDYKDYTDKIFAERNSGYQYMINNFMHLMEDAGLDRQEFSDLVWRMNLHQDPADYEKIIRDKISQVLPGIELPKTEFGKVMNRINYLRQWQDIIIDQREQLNKPKGRIF